MGRTLLTATLRVHQFEGEWKIFARAPRSADREAFAELCAFAHFHAAAMAHAASPYNFEMILLTMLVGLAHRAEILQGLGILRFYNSSTEVQEPESLFQTEMRGIMLELRQRLTAQGHELWTFARALRREDQHALRALLNATQADTTRTLPLVGPPSDEALNTALLTALVHIMRRIRQLEKQYVTEGALVSAEDWGNICVVT